MVVPHKQQFNWTFLQIAVWLICFSIIILLFVQPEIGLHAFWDVLIPVAPALIVFLPGLWRNICPVSVLSQLPRRVGKNKQVKMSTGVHGWFVLLGVVLLLLIIPLRHTFFDLNGPGTALFLITATCLAIGLSFWFDGKSGWCASICPVHQVEKLYGQKPLTKFSNAHCKECSKCVTGCPDTTPAPSMHLGGKTLPRRAAAFGLLGAFPGYVWGWFQVPDYPTLQEGIQNLGNTYLLPIAGGCATLALYALFISSVSMHTRKHIDRFFAAGAVSIYYWYRLPWLFGFSAFEHNGMLIDLTETIPTWLITVVPYCTTALFVWWIALRKNGLRSWLERPPSKETTNTVDLTVSA